MEFEDELGGQPYRPKLLSGEGWRQFPRLMRDAIEGGDETTLARALNRPDYFQDGTRATKTGRSRVRTSPDSASRMLGLSEFNTWYVRGLCRRLIEEDVDACEVYLADLAVTPRCECTGWEGETFSVEDVYNGHRAQYHGAGADRRAFSVPCGPDCHYSIRRVD